MNDIIGKIRIDGSGIQAGLNQAKSGIDRWASGVKGTVAGIFSGTAFVSAIRKTIADIDQIGDVSEEFDIPVEQVQALKIAATEASDSFEKLLAILTKIQDIQIDIVKGDTGQGQKNRSLLQRHGISVDAINKMSVTEFAKVIADRINNKTELNQLLGPKMGGKFELYRGSLSNMDENVAKGIASGRIKSKAEIDEINRMVTEGKKLWGSIWDTIVNRLYMMASILSDIIDALNVVYDKIPLPPDFKKELGKYLWEGPLIYYYKLFKTKNAPSQPPVDITRTPLLPEAGGTPLHTDALLSVGNFLGQGLQNITAMTTLVEETKTQTEILRHIEANTEKSMSQNEFLIRLFITPPGLPLWYL